MKGRLSAAVVVATAVTLVSPPALANDTEVFLDSAVSVDIAHGRVTLPLHRGTSRGKTVWYVLTESSDKHQAERLGINAAEKLVNALGTKAVQRGTWRNGRIDFAGTVDFSPRRVVVPGPNGFPPVRFAPGAVGDARYSPLVTTNGRVVLNATHVINATGYHDAIVSVDWAHRTVTLDSFNGFYEGERIQYLHQEASVRLVAAIEGSTFAPNLDAAPAPGRTEGKDTARSAIVPIVNGPRGRGNPQRQGLESALLGQGDPLNITQEIPDESDYSPVWDVTPAVWTAAAIRSGERRRLTDQKDVADLFEEGLLVSAGMGPRNESLEGLRALPGISNCPVVLTLGD